MKNFFKMGSANLLAGKTDRAMTRAKSNPTPANSKIVTDLVERLVVSALTQAGAKYAGDPEGPRRKHA